jgi:hypothetical protein
MLTCTSNLVAAKLTAVQVLKQLLWLRGKLRHNAVGKV